MKTVKHAGFWVGALTAVAVAAGAPLVANAAGEAHGGGGGGGAHVSGGGGAHFSGGGGHAAMGGGHPGFAGARPGFAGARPGFAGARPGVAGGAPHGYYGANAHAHYAVSANHVYGGYPAGASHFVARTGGFAGGRPALGGHRGFVNGSGRFWGGGYWGGRFWPGVHYGAGFAWFLPVLPFGYATYYWGGNPYYYYDGGYYSWDPSYNGYVATDPPPVADTASGSGTDEAPPSDDGQAPQSYDVQPQTYAPPPTNPNNVVASPPPSSPPVSSTAPRGNFSGGISDIIAYPRNGQNDQQTSTDKFECHKWSVAQTGFDPTRSMNLQGTAMDYHRAMGACMDARGYTVR